MFSDFGRIGGNLVNDDTLWRRVAAPDGGKTNCKSSFSAFGFVWQCAFPTVEFIMSFLFYWDRLKGSKIEPHRKSFYFVSGTAGR